MSNPYESPISPPEFGPGPLANSRRIRAIWFRLAIAVSVLSLYVAANFPWNANQPPEDYAFSGPLWFLTVGTATDRIIAAVITAGCLTAAGASIVWPRWYTALLCAIAIGIWAVTGVVLAGAAC